MATMGSLDELWNEWEHCQRCELGIRRESVHGAFVFGEGTPGGVMFVGEGPGIEEEEQGRPFVGTSGAILRQILSKLNFTTYYITNCVTCRSCTIVVDDAGNPRLRRGLPMYKDERPIAPQIEACRPRLEEEIYRVDPVVIVALGGTAAETLLRRQVSITKIRGIVEHAYVHGATHVPVLTEKKGAWARKSGGALSFPTEPNEVRYLVVPTLHPAFVARQLADKGPRGAFQLLVSDIKLAIKIYERHQLYIYGDEPKGTLDEIEEDDYRGADHS